ncbi:MAG: ATP-binding cassette domain-containing protein [Planctomycetes bacterium]|nr:ATP-binding cassette domain-containing protein [Planctomycetota bacterium]
MIELRDVCKRLGERQVLDHMSFRVPKGMNFVLMGPSGCGKSVTLKHVIGILRPDSGSVQVDDQDVQSMDRAQLMALRKRMGYLFQNGALINWLTVAENVALPLREHARVSKSELQQRVHEVLGLVGMDHAATQYPPAISGGMKLRTGLARALVTNPEYVLYDEPNAGLDPIISKQIHELIVEVRDRLGVTGLIVTHSRACATQCGDRIGIIENGRLGIEGSVAEILASDNPLARSFLDGGTD